MKGGYAQKIVPTVLIENDNSHLTAPVKKELTDEDKLLTEPSTTKSLMITSKTKPK